MEPLIIILIGFLLVRAGIKWTDNCMDGKYDNKDKYK